MHVIRQNDTGDDFKWALGSDLLDTSAYQIDRCGMMKQRTTIVRDERKEEDAAKVRVRVGTRASAQFNGVEASCVGWALPTNESTAVGSAHPTSFDVVGSGNGWVARTFRLFVPLSN